MAGDLKFIIGAVDNASATLAKVGKETEKLGASTAKMNAASRLIGAGAIIAFGAASVKAYAEAEAQQVKLQEAYRKFPALASVNISSMRALNDAIQAKTGTDNDDLAAAEAKLAMYNLTGEQIQKLIPIVNDYAVANGIGVTEAAGKVGKAMMGNAKALKDIGINFKSTGDKAKDFQTIYDALNSKVGGAGEAFGAGTEGQLKILAASFQDLQEEVGAQLVPALKTLVDIEVPLLGAFGKLPEPVKSATVMIAGAAAAALLLGPRLIMLGTALQGLVPEAAEAAVALEGEAVAAGTAGAASGGAAGKIGTMGKALGGIGIGIALTVAVADAFQYLLDKVGAGSDAVNGLAGAVAKQDKAAATSAINSYKAAQGVNDWKTQVGLLVGTWGMAAPAVIAGFINAGKASDNFGEQLAQMVSSGNGKEAAQIVSALGMSAEEAAAKFPAYAAALGDAKRAIGPYGSAVDEATGLTDDFSTALADAYDPTAALSDSVSGLRKAADDLKKSLDNLSTPTLDADAATIDLNKSYADASSVMKEVTDAQSKLGRVVKNGKSEFDLNTEAGQKASTALQDIASKSLKTTAAYAAQGRSSKVLEKNTQDARNKFVDLATHMGLSETAANSLADSYGLIPKKVSSEAKLKTDAAIANDDELKSRLNRYNAIHPNVTVSVSDHGAGQTQDDIEETRRRALSLDGKTSNVYIITHQLTVTTRAGGGTIDGAISGPGSGTSDSIPVDLSNGEYVIKASSAARLGMGLLNDLNDNGQIDGQGRRKFATGGAALLAHFVSSTNTAIAAEQELKKLKGDKFSLFSSTMASIGSSAALPSIFNIGAYKDAQANVASARQRLNLATTPQERASATAELDQAEAAARDSKPTAGNILKSMQAKLKQIQTFGANLSKLSKEKKLPVSLIRQLIAAGPEEGGALAEALLNGSAADYKAIISAAADTDKVSFDIGQFEAGIVYDPLITKQRAKVQAALSKATHDRDLVVHTTLTVDGKALAEALVQYKRAIGGRKLGLD